MPPSAARRAARTARLLARQERGAADRSPPYPRYPVHASGDLLRLSFAVQDAANRSASAVRDIVVVSNAADTAVSNGAAVRRFVFLAALGLNHDVIDVNQPEQRVDLVYPTLITLIEE